MGIHNLTNVTAGSVLVLHKDGLLMFSIDTKVPPTSTYNDGKLSMGFGATRATNLALGQKQPGATVAMCRSVSS
jgi:hypothetical protein